MKSEMERVLEESREVGIAFLRTELETGNTLLDVSGSTEIESTRARTLENARRVYDLVLRLMRKLDLSAAEVGELEAGLTNMKRRLDSPPHKSASAPQQE